VLHALFIVELHVYSRLRYHKGSVRTYTPSFPEISAGFTCLYRTHSLRIVYQFILLTSCTVICVSMRSSVANPLYSWAAQIFNIFYVNQNRVIIANMYILASKQGSSRTGTHGNAVSVLFYTTGTSFPLFFVYSSC